MPDVSDIDIKDFVLVLIEKAREEEDGEICLTAEMTKEGGKPEKWRILCSRLHIEE